MQLPSCFAGVDVSKAKLDVSLNGCDRVDTVVNESTAIDTWLKQLPGGCAVAVESTGRYHQLLVQRANAAGVTVFVLNARDVFFYAKALGARGKTDRLDAQVIARYLAEHYSRLRPCILASATALHVEQLLRQRWAVVSKQVALRQALHECVAVGVPEHIDAAFKTALKLIDQRICQLIDQDPAMSRLQTLLKTITGFGPQASGLLATLLTRTHFANSDALVAYAGLDPRPNDSGSKRGRRTLSKRGSPQLRRTMFLVAFAACHSKALKPTYQALKARSLATTEALIVLARKLLRAAYAVWKTQMPFDLTKLGIVHP
jgi:transposase